MSNVRERPAVSALVLNFNGHRVLGRKLADCVEALLASSEMHVTVYVVDNGSTDDSVDWLRERFPGIRVIELGRNLGWSGGYQASLRTVDDGSKYVFLANNDMEVDPRCLSLLVSFMDRNPRVGAVQPLIVNIESGIPNVGFLLSNLGGIRKTARDQGDTVDRSHPVSYPSGAALLLRSSVATGFGDLLFNQRYFFGYDDTLVGWTLWLLGYECRCLPSAQVLHIGGATISKQDPSVLQYHGLKNRLLTMFRNLERRNLNLLFERLVLDFLGVLKREHTPGSVVSAVWYFVRNIRQLSSERNLMQQRRQVSDKFLFEKGILRKMSFIKAALSRTRFWPRGGTGEGSDWFFV